MKNPLSILLTCLIVISTSLSKAQTQSNNSDIYSDNSIIGKFMTKVKDRKEKKYEFYFGYYKPNFRTKEYTEWSNPFTANHAENDTVFYTKQLNEKHSDKIYGRTGLSIGYNKIQNLNDKWNIKYGIGFTMFRFYHVPKAEIIEEIILNKNTLIRIPKTIKDTVLTEVFMEPKNYGQSGSFFYNHLEPNYIVASILFPFSIEYKIHKNLLIGGDMSFTIPIRAEVSKTYYDNYFNKESIIYTPTTKISRLIPQAGFHIKYKFANYFYTSINASTGVVLRTYELIEDKKYNEYHKLEPLYYSYGLTLGVNI